MDNFPTFPFTTQEDWYGELSFTSAEDGAPLSLEGRNFEMLITPAASGADLVEPKITLTMDNRGGLSLKNGDPSTIIFRVPKATANELVRMEYTADVLEVVGDSRYLFMPARIDYFEPSALRIFLSRFLGVSVSFAARRQPIVTPVAVPGRQGDRGNSILSGFRAPGPADGKIGDFWVDLGTSTQAPRFYQPKTAVGWTDNFVEIISNQILTDALARAAMVNSVRFSAGDQNLSAGQTTLTIPSGYIPGVIMVFRNGSVLQTSDYTATNGSQIVLKTAARSDDVIDVRSFKIGAVVNAAPAQHDHQIDNIVGLSDVLTNKLDRRLLSKDGAPVATEIPAGTIRAAKNTTTGRISIFANDGGTIVDLLDLTNS